MLFNPLSRFFSAFPLLAGLTLLTLFMGAALAASMRPEPSQPIYLAFHFLQHKADSSAEPADPVKQGREILESRCSTCHTAPDPHSHTLSDWPAVLNRMAPRAFLNPSDETLIMRYFEEVLKPTPTPAPAQ